MACHMRHHQRGAPTHSRTTTRRGLQSSLNLARRAAHHPRAHYVRRAVPLCGLAAPRTALGPFNAVDVRCDCCNLTVKTDDLCCGVITITRAMPSRGRGSPHGAMLGCIRLMQVKYDSALASVQLLRKHGGPRTRPHEHARTRGIKVLLQYPAVRLASPGRSIQRSNRWIRYLLGLSKYCRPLPRLLVVG